MIEVVPAETLFQVKVLQGIVGKGSSSTLHLAEFVRDTDGHHPPGGVDALRDLVTRLDMNGWWKQQADAARNTRRSTKGHTDAPIDIATGA